ncbi:MAG: riboflavin synthase [Crenarchaeota archaeon]|nr:riboflavin synthase [Thermoproteota archaeon]
MSRLKIGIIDTTFARVDMASVVIEEIRKLEPQAEIIRWTVPGIKDIPGAAKRIIDFHSCDGLIVLGWVGKEFVDKLSYVAYSVGIMLVGILTSKPIIDVTVHEEESEDPKELKKIAIDRARKHARNLIYVIKDPTYLTKWSGKGLRQGYPDVGPID